MATNTVSRRVFLGAAGAGVVGACTDSAQQALGADAGGGPDATGGDTQSGPDLDDTAAGPDDTQAGPDLDDVGADEPDLTLPAGSTAVAAVGIADDDVEAAVRRAVHLAGGLDAVTSGQTVFVKPNAVHPFALEPGVLTSAAVLAAVVRLLKERGAKVIVGDRPARGFASEAVLQDSGLADAAREAGADEIYGPLTPTEDPDAWVLVQPPGYEATWGGQGGLLAMRRILESDHFINVCVCKNHRWGVFSLTQKNLMGAVGDPSRDQMHYVKEEPDQLARDIATLNAAFQPLLNLIDATTCMVNGGPEGFAPEAVFTRPGLIVAGRDRVATDALGAALIQHMQAGATIEQPDAVQAVLRDTPTWQLPQILRGHEAGLGVASAEAVVLRFDGVDAALSQALEARYRAV